MGVVAAGIAARRRGVVTLSGTVGAYRSLARNAVETSRAIDMPVTCAAAFKALASATRNQKTCRQERCFLVPTARLPLRARD
ncbi:hypothetical protein HPB52_020336 [Rhipicephalus sanguineus]|uniref:Uncharacterized protein n=1 Tax=Rhipicephalus sanguineus TaxID=34632 RepID=A0A9D4Q2J2_RHISA|nr:hypothetical protein HPB52_020336 [Rhipicephalus sanguineus]